MTSPSLKTSPTPRWTREQIRAASRAELTALMAKWAVNCKRFTLTNGWDEQVIRNSLMPRLNEDIQKVLRSGQKTFAEQ